MDDRAPPAGLSAAAAREEVTRQQEGQRLAPAGRAPATVLGPPGHADAADQGSLVLHVDVEQPEALHLKSELECALGSSFQLEELGPGDHDADDKKTSPGPLRTMWRNMWLLLLMAGFIVIICVARERLKSSDPGEGWHSITALSPVTTEVDGDPVFLQVDVMLPPWEAGHEEATLVLPPAQGHRRSLAHMLLASPTRQLLSSGSPPALKIFVGQQLLSGAAAEGRPAVQWTPITDTQTCTYDSTASQKCVFEFKDVQRINASLPAAVVVASAGNSTAALTAHVEVVSMGYFGKAKDWVALVILVLVLLALAFEVMHRMWIAFIGAFAMTGLLLIANLAPELATVAAWIDTGTMALLFGMMIIVGQMQHTGTFEVICAWCIKSSKGNFAVLTILLCTITAFVSAWLDNVTTMLLMAPMTMAVYKALDRDPVPLLVAQAMLSNIGGTATMVGDPPNIIIGNVLQQTIGFNDFIINLGPAAVIITPICIALMLLLYKRHLTGKVDNLDEVMRLTSGHKIKNWKLFWLCMYATGGVILAFLLQPIHHLNPGYVAVIGATILVVAAEPHDAHAVLAAVEWDMLLFFAGMFIMVEAAVELGLMRRIAAFINLIISTAPQDAQEIAAVECILWFSAIFSAVLDNIPYTIAMLPVIKQLAADSEQLDLTVLAWALALGACLGGNGTLIGASANIVTAGMAGREGHKLTFMSWLYAGIPITVVSVAVANVYMLLRYCL